MAEFFARARALYRDHDFDVQTKQELVLPSDAKPGEYNPDWFHPRGIFDDGEVFRLTDQFLMPEDVPGYDTAPRKQKAEIRLNVEQQNQSFGTFDANGDTQSESVTIPIFKADKTTLVSNGVSTSYFGFIIIDGFTFLGVTSVSNGFAIYGNPGPGFKFPEKIAGFPLPYLDGNGKLQQTDTDFNILPFLASSEFTSGPDVWSGNNGNNTAKMLAGDDVGRGKAGNDLIAGDAGLDKLYGGGGNDDLFGGSGKDFLFGQDGRDFIFGEDGSDFLEGGKGADRLEGGKGRDDLQGGAGNDKLFGGAGDDFLRGGGGRDKLTGGKGIDDFIFSDRNGINIITDFNANSNKEDIVLRDVSAIAGFRDLFKFHLSQRGADVVIDDFDGTEIYILNTDINDLDKFDFIF